MLVDRQIHLERSAATRVKSDMPWSLKQMSLELGEASGCLWMGRQLVGEVEVVMPPWRLSCEATARCPSPPYLSGLGYMAVHHHVDIGVASNSKRRSDSLLAGGGSGFVVQISDEAVRRSREGGVRRVTHSAKHH